MKLTDKQKSLVRMCLWVGSLAWAVFFFAYGLLLMPAFMEVIDRFYPTNVYAEWVSGIFYVLSLVTAVVIFFWFFNHLFKRVKKADTEESPVADKEDEGS